MQLRGSSATSAGRVVAACCSCDRITIAAVEVGLAINQKGYWVPIIYSWMEHPYTVVGVVLHNSR